MFFVTGRPGTGKTTIVLSAAQGLRDKGYIVGGMLSKEVREKGTRIGFEIIDVATGEKGWLAHVNQPTGPQVSKYKVNLHDLDRIGAKSIHNAMKDADAVIVDEIGPMELFSSAFRQVVRDLITSEKLVLGVIHYRARNTVLDSIKTRKDAEIIEATMGNRQDLHNLLIQKAVQFLVEARKTYRVRGLDNEAESSC